MDSQRRSWGERSRVTLQDVAREAGVSQSAASVVLNSARSGTGVSAEKRQLVIAAAQRMGYRPNAIARALSTGRTNCIGVYASEFELDATNSFFADLLGGAFKGAREFGLNTTLHTAGMAPSALLDLVSNRSIDGLILHARPHDPILEFLSELRMPAVAIVDGLESIPSVVVDDRSGGALLAQHLFTLGHRHVLFRSSMAREVSAVAREAGFTETATRLGIRVTQSMAPEHDLEGVTAHDLELFNSGADRATAIVAWCDYIAEKACSRLYQLGISVPGHVAVAGFDGFKFASDPIFRLTTIRAPWSTVAHEAVRVLNDLITGREVSDVTVVPVEFLRGTTT